MPTLKLIRNSKIIALVTFLLGSLLFSVQFLSSESSIAFVAFFFILIAGAVNSIVVILLIIHYIKITTDRGRIVRTILTVALNVPVALFYTWFFYLLINTMRISFVNETNSIVGGITIEGCDQASYIERLSVGESKTVWVKINNDCMVTVRYKMGAIEINENVTGLVPRNGGHALTFKLGTNQKTRQ
ncbi:MAG: hypothetical protein NT007_07610 [Candidatus Kapabacteria bacterium]|nr:hypothetical protein [Candidatus Kapabacteria bacterium]